MRRELAALATFAFTVVAACNAIVGVTDVRLKKDTTPTDDGGGDDARGDSGSEAGPPPPANILEVALGGTHTCARKPEGTVKCWGDDSLGQTGTNGVAGDGGAVLAASDTGVADARHIASGKSHTCIIHTSGKVSCWGSDVSGQLGDNNPGGKSPVPVDVMSVGDATAICAGGNFTCVLRQGGGAACWGDNLSGQLGTPNIASQSAVPVQVQNVSDLVTIACGELHACAATSTGKVYCWGENSHGELGNGGTSGSIPTPAPLATIDSVFSLAAGRRSTCALKKNGDVFCWGANDLGQLGSGTASSAPTPSPTQVPGLKAAALWAGADHACAVKSGGVGIVCWGSGYYGQLGDNVVRDDASIPQATPVSVNGINRTAIGVGTGGNHSCAPLDTGAILCWGANERGQIGNGTTNPALTPESVMGYP